MHKKITLAEKRRRLASKKLQRKLKKRGLQTAVPTDTDVRNLLQYHQTGRFHDAERLARLLIQQFPNHQLTWKILGSVLTQIGRDPEAVDAHKKAVELSPEDAEAHYNLGNALKAAVRLKEAEISYRQAIFLKSFYAEAHNNLGSTLRDLGRVEEAIASCKKAIAFKADYDGAHYNLANLFQDADRLEEAESSYQHSIELKPHYAEAHCNLAVTLQRLGKIEEAEKSCRRAIALKADYAEAHKNLGAVLHISGKWKEAESSFRQAIKIKPNLAEAYSNLGNLLKELDRQEEAESYYEQAIAIKPDYAEAKYNLGINYGDQGKLEQAVEAYNEAIFLKPDYPAAHYNLGKALQEQGKLKESVEAFKIALSIKPDYANALNNMGNALLDQCQLEEAIEAYMKALSLKPDSLEAYSNIIFCLDSATNKYPKLYKEIIESFSNLASSKAKKKFESKIRSCSQKIRLGFVSGDLRDHPVGYFSEHLFKYIDKGCFQLFVYDNTNQSSNQTEVLKSFTTAWRVIKGMSDCETAQVIHKDAIDVLIDLSGHTAHNRLTVFALRPSAIQATWMGYFGSTGLNEMDFLIGDKFVTPVDKQQDFSESVILLTNSYLCFAPPSFDLPISATPALAQRYVTFGCFNNSSKINSDVIVSWSAILKEIKDSKIFFKGKTYNGDAIQRITAEFEINQIDANRLLFGAGCSRKELLQSYKQVDVALDPFPYVGGTTTCEALWMGVPTLTKQGTDFLSNVGRSIAENSGHDHLCAANTSDYISLAINIASDVDLLNQSRIQRREKLINTPLFDGKRFAKDFERVIETMLGGLPQDG